MRTEKGFRFRPIKEADLRAVTDLLEEVNLPSSDIALKNNFFIGSFHGGELIACGGVESYPPIGLLRSLAVSPRHRNLKLGWMLLKALEQEAMAAGIGELYLLTETAGTYFARFGYQPLPRDKAPEVLSKTSQFKRVCPASATLMIKSMA